MCVENYQFVTGAEQIVTSCVVILYCVLSDMLLDGECSTLCHSGRAQKCTCAGNFCLVPNNICVGGSNKRKSVSYITFILLLNNKLKTNLSARYVKTCNAVAVRHKV